MNKTAAPDERKHLRGLGWKNGLVCVLQLCVCMCVCTVLVAAPASEWLRSLAQAEVRASGEAACTNYLCESTFLEASFL